MRRYLTLGLIALLITVTFFNDFFIKKLRPADEYLNLKEENEKLKAEIQKNAITDLKLLDQNSDRVKAVVFSTYPFNVKNEIVVSAGRAQGIQEGLAAVLGGEILVGKVKSVRVDSSVVQTLFDPGFETPIRIGDTAVDGLLVGGNRPKIVLIEKDKKVSQGDLIYTAVDSMPYGLKIGNILEIKNSPNTSFQEASLTVPFSVGDLRLVEILK